MLQLVKRHDFAFKKICTTQMHTQKFKNIRYEKYSVIAKVYNLHLKNKNNCNKDRNNWKFNLLQTNFCSSIGRHAV